jgi:hypothetical protein
VSGSGARQDSNLQPDRYERSCHERPSICPPIDDRDLIDRHVDGVVVKPDVIEAELGKAT